MERWMKLSGDVPCLSLIPLGTYHNEQYYFDDECLIHLEEINIKLKDEDPTTRPIRCNVGFLDIFNKDLIPILVNSKDQPDILNSTIKLLAELTTPLECLDMINVMVKSNRSTATQQIVIYKLTQLLYRAKESFLDGRTTRAVLDHVYHNLGKQPLSSNDSRSVNYSLLLIRNILHATERPLKKADNVFHIATAVHRDKQDHEPLSYKYNYDNTSTNYTQQDQLMRNLFAQGLDRLLVNLLACAQKEQWTATIVQLVSLLYKDRPVENILAILDEKYADVGITSESSIDEDQRQFDKSRRSSRQSNSSGFHSEDSNAPNSKQKIASPRVTDSLTRKCKRNENSSGNESQSNKFQRSSSESSQTSETKSFEGSKKQQKTSEKFNKCRRCEIKTNSCKQNEEDISTLLKEFTINFMHGGYNALVGQLHQQLRKQSDAHLLDKSHFLWLISYFLPVASQLGVSVEHLKDVLTIDLLCYLTWEAVHQTEELEIDALQPSVDLKPCVRRLHLCVQAIREYLKTLERFSRPDSNQIGNGPTLIGCQDLIIQLRGYVPAIRDLRQLFLLQLRQFNPVVQSRSYLLDVITANHILLITLERAAHPSSHGTMSFDINQHLTQFCSKTILDRYGTALEDFKSNGPFANDCILTILHHVAGNLGRADLLCKPAILRPFSKIWKEGFNMCDEWNDLIEYITHKSLRNFLNVETLFKKRNRTRNQETPYSTEIVPRKYSDEIQNGKNADQNHIANIESLLVQLKNSGFQKQLDWIQSSLLSACAARLGSYSGQEFCHPITCLSFQMNLSCPVVPWTEVEASALRSELFFFLLLNIGLIHSASQNALYPRIPYEWLPDTLYSVALLFGPVDQKRIDFDLTRVKKIELYLPISPINVFKEGSSKQKSPYRYAICYDSYMSLESGKQIPIPSHEGDDSVFDQHSPRPWDSISTTSSLEVHKTDSSDEEDGRS